ncbi:hypothetical protein CHARACLAT_026434 [Characodon lateralis]|uniref:Uncharacterized protein n=1 Tax=Characodon lateralis TaxID=208331 RepID=A0ABU7DXL5_9TELE|nr:hypothetical protein [Characodon lateralis]
MDTESVLQCTKDYYASNLRNRPAATFQSLICTLILADKPHKLALKINLQTSQYMKTVNEVKNEVKV